MALRMPIFINFVCEILPHTPPSGSVRNIKADDCCHLDTGPELYKDAPIGVQVVGYRQLDEALMNTATVLDSIINGKR